VFSACNAKLLALDASTCFGQTFKMFFRRILSTGRKQSFYQYQMISGAKCELHSGNLLAFIFDLSYCGLKFTVAPQNVFFLLAERTVS